jgi:hypothetical protein
MALAAKTAIDGWFPILVYDRVQLRQNNSMQIKYLSHSPAMRSELDPR